MEDQYLRLKLVKNEISGAVLYEGFALGYQAADDQPLWAIRRTSYEAGVKVYMWALLGRARAKWTDRISYFPSPPSGSFPAQLVSITDFDGTPFGPGHPLYVAGNFAASGLRNRGLITETPINGTTWTALPSSALPNRNAITIQNRTGGEIKLNYDNAASGYVGVVIATNSERFYDITETIVIYAKSAAAGPVTITVEELS